MFGSPISYWNDKLEADAAALDAVEEKPKVAQTPAPKGITFNMYCTLKKIPERHRAGMRAFTKVQRATFEEWERVFLHY